MSDAFRHARFVALTGSVEAWTGVQQEAAGTLALIAGGAEGRRTLLSGLRHVRGLAFAADGSALALFIDEDGDERGGVATWTRGREGVETWNVRAGTDALVSDALAVQELAISNAGTRLALLIETADGFEILAGTSASGRQLASVLRDAGPLRGLALSSDGQYLAVAAKAAGEGATWTLRLVTLGDDVEGSAAALALETTDDLFPCTVLSGPDPVVLVSTSSGAGEHRARGRRAGECALEPGWERHVPVVGCRHAADARVVRSVDRTTIRDARGGC